MSDRILGLAGLALAAFYIWATTLIQESFISDPAGPKAFPLVIALLLVVSCLAMILRPDAEPDWPSIGSPAGLLVAIAAFAVIGYALPEIGLRLWTLQPKQAGLVFAIWLLVAPSLSVLAAGRFGRIGPLTEMLLAAGMMVAYALALPDLGFLIATIVATTYLCWRLGTVPWQAATAGVATAFGIYIVFHLGLGLSLARGPLGI